MQLDPKPEFRAKGGPWPTGYFTLTGRWEILDINSIMLSGTRDDEFGNHGRYLKKLHFTMMDATRLMGHSEDGDQVVWQKVG
jgi:hypothetical protein